MMNHEKPKYQSIHKNLVILINIDIPLRIQMLKNLVVSICFALVAAMNEKQGLQLIGIENYYAT
jgi:hypothetical protein